MNEQAFPPSAPPYGLPSASPPPLSGSYVGQSSQLLVNGPRQPQTDYGYGVPQTPPVLYQLDNTIIGAFSFVGDTFGRQPGRGLQSDFDSAHRADAVRLHGPNLRERAVGEQRLHSEVRPLMSRYSVPHTACVGSTARRRRPSSKFALAPARWRRGVS